MSMRIKSSWKAILPIALSVLITQATPAPAKAETGFEDLILNGVKTGPLKAPPQQQPSLQNSRSVAASRDDAETRGDAAYKAGKYLDAAMFFNAGITSYDDKYAPLYIKRARALTHLQRHAEALTMLDKATTIDPQIMQQKENQDLLKQVKETIASSHARSSDIAPPASIKAMMAQGAAAESKRDYAAALTSYEKALKLDRSYGGLFTGLARCYLALDDKQKATLAADWLAESGQKAQRPGDLAFAATICNAAGRHDRAASISASGLDITQALAPENREEATLNDLLTQKAIAGAHVDLADCDQAIKLLQDKNAALNASLALMMRHAATGNIKLIEDEYSRALALDNSKLRTHATAFDAYLFAKNTQQAYLAGQKACEIDGEPRFLLAEHDSLIAQKKLAQALPLIDKIVQSQPTYSKYRIFRASNLYQQNRATDALKDLDLVLQKEPDNEQALGFRASIAAAQNDFATCFADSSRMSQLNPDAQRWYKNAVRAGLRTARYTEVESIAQKGLTKFSFDDDLKSAKALAMMAQGSKKLAEAQAYLERECEIKPQNSLLFALQAQSLYKQGKAPQAAKLLSEFIAHGYPGADAGRPLAIKAGLDLEMGDYKSAIDDLAALAACMPADKQAARRSLYYFAAAQVARLAGDQARAARYQDLVSSTNQTQSQSQDKTQDKQIAAMQAAFAQISSDRSKYGDLFKAVIKAGPQYIDETTIESDLAGVLSANSTSSMSHSATYVSSAFR